MFTTTTTKRLLALHRATTGVPGSRVSPMTETLESRMLLAATLQSLGDLPGGGFYSRANAVSADGSVVVGNSDSGKGQFGEAFRWTAAGGMVGLGDLPGGDFYSDATGVSADGSVVVGTTYSSSGLEPFR